MSGDGDSLSIGLGQMCHAIRRNVNLLYVLENNGVYGLTKGQFSASADKGSLAKKGEANSMEAIDGVLLAMTLGATFVARSFSGDKAQLVPIIKAGLAHRGFAFVDVISPCVTFNDHEGSTKSYAYTREKMVEVVQADFVPPAEEITTDYEAGSVKNVMLHDGGWVRLRKVAEDYDATDRDRAYALHPRAAARRRSRHRPALHLARLAGRPRPEQHRARLAHRSRLRAVVPGQRRAAETAGWIQIGLAPFGREQGGRAFGGAWLTCERAKRCSPCTRAKRRVALRAKRALLAPERREPSVRRRFFQCLLALLDRLAQLGGARVLRIVGAGGVDVVQRALVVAHQDLRFRAAQQDSPRGCA